VGEENVYLEVDDGVAAFMRGHAGSDLRSVGSRPWSRQWCSTKNYVRWLSDCGYHELDAFMSREW